MKLNYTVSLRNNVLKLVVVTVHYLPTYFKIKILYETNTKHPETGEYCFVINIS